MSNSRKTWLGILVAACVALALAVPAFATVGGAGYTTWNSLWPGNGSSPHSGFATTTQKCVVCHAVHGGNAIGQALLNGTIAGACNYCHVLATSAYSQVYNSTPSLYSTDTVYGHGSWVVGPTTYGVKCTQCHQVHAAASSMTSNTYLISKMLKGEKTAIGYDIDAGAPAQLEASGTALAKWCTSCHGTSIGSPPASPDYYNTSFNGSSHIMTTSIAAYGNIDSSVETTKVAWADTATCQSCHASGFGTSAWPHYTAGARFLVSSINASVASVPATNTNVDGVCLRCHQSGYSTGVNMSF